MRTSLFRQEALDFRRATLVGSVLAARRLPMRLVTSLSVCAALALVALGVFGEYTSKIRVSGYLAPSAGLVDEGGPATQAQAARLAILPAGTVLEARLLVPNRAIGFVAVGDAVSLRYAALPYQHFGTFKGRVTEIPRAMVLAGEPGAPIPTGEAVYLVKVALEQQRVRTGRAEVSLQSGMALEADLPLERQRLAAWLFEPLPGLASKG